MVFDRPTPQMGTEDDTLGRRIAAVIIDTILILVVLGVLTGLIGFAGGAEMTTLVSFLGSVFGIAYYIYFEGASGQTVGKKVMDIVVVTEDGEAIGYGKSAIRNILRIIDQLPFLYVIGIILIVVTDKGQRLGDIAADTVVVRAQG